MLALIAVVSIARADDDLSDALDDLRVQALVATLRDDGAAAKWSAAKALSALGEPGAASLVRGLGSTDAATRLRCVEAIQEFVPPPVSAFPCLVEMLGGARDDYEREVIAAALVPFGDVTQRAVPVYLSSAAGNGPMSREFAYLGLGHVGPTEETIQVMIDGLGDADPDVRAIAAAVLAPKDWCSMRDRWHEHDRIRDPVPWTSLWTDPGFSRHRGAILCRLVPLLHHPEYEVRALAANGLGRAEAPLPDDALRALGNALADNEDEVRWRSAAALAALAERGVAPRAVLMPMLRSRDHLQQTLAAEAAWRLGDGAAALLPGLNHVWEAPESLAAKEAAAAALCRLGHATDEMIGQLAAAYSDIDPWDTNRFSKERRDQLAGWLRAAGDAYAVLVEAAKGARSVEVNYWYRGLGREDAVRALEAFHARGDETIPVLRQLLDGAGPWEVRFRAAELLQRLGAGRDAYERQLGELIDGGDSYWLVIATRLLLRADPGSQRPVPRLLRALSEKSPVAGGQPFEMAGLLAGIGRLPPAAKAPLLRAARSDEAQLRAEALRALGHLADPDEEVRGFLWAMLDGSDSAAAAKGLAGFVRSPADIERLLARARGLDWTFFKLLAADPPVAHAAKEVLTRMGKEGVRLSLASTALDTIAPDSEAAREVHLRLLRSAGPEDFASGWMQGRWWILAHGKPGDRAFVPPLARGLFLAAQDERRWRVARDALLKVAEPEDLARIAAALDDALHAPETKREALAALGAMGSRASSAIPAIRELEDDPDLRSLAAATRERIAR